MREGPVPHGSEVPEGTTFSEENGFTDELLQ
jgi:hypothetical protein